MGAGESPEPIKDRTAGLSSVAAQSQSNTSGKLWSYGVCCSDCGRTQVSPQSPVAGDAVHYYLGVEVFCHSTADILHSLYEGADQNSSGQPDEKEIQMGDRRSEKMIFEAFLRTNSDFAGDAIAKWEQPEDDPPDILCTTTSCRRIGVELGEWLNEGQIRKAKGSETIQRSILQAIGQPPPNGTENIYFAWLHPKSKARVKPADAAGFRVELFKLVKDVDARWEQEPNWQSPQGCWYEDFKLYPTVGKYLSRITFFPRKHYSGWPPNGRVEKRAWPNGCDWLIFEAPGGVYSENSMVNALFEIITKKIEKYEAKPPAIPLDEFCLLIHYNQAWVYNSPVETPSFTFDDVAAAATNFIGDDPGPFGRIFLFIALQPGEKVLQLYQL
jgi:hypothetical protein